jgi:methyltransferase (TIGR00027 family)
MSESDIETNLASTACWTASVRALESARPDRLIDDPWAAALAGEEGQRWLAQRSPESVLPIVLRTRYFDDFLQRITEENALRQIVLMAAGLDTRAFRLTWPAGTRLFELDRIGMLAAKDGVLQVAGAMAACDRHIIPVDLTGPWQERLVASGFDPGQPSAWLLEGFLFYLPSESILRLLDELNLLATPGSWLGFDVINSAMLTSPLTRRWIEMQASSGAPWIGVLDDPQTFLTERGWQASLTQAGQTDANHGRWTFPVIPTSMPGMPHNWFVTAYKTMVKQQV